MDNVQKLPHNDKHKLLESQELNLFCLDDSSYPNTTYF